MIGQKVKLTKSMAKWYTEHPEIFFTPSGECSDEYDVAMQNSLYTLMGGNVIGTVLRNGADANVYGVEFVSSFGKYFAYYELGRDINQVRGN